MQKFVVGFLFNEVQDRVLLIEKNKPRWQEGRFNGIGGEVKTGEIFLHAMCREFKEETGIDYELPWRLYYTMQDVLATWKVKFYSATSVMVRSASSPTDEKVVLAFTWDLPQNILHSLLWLIPMALDNSINVAAGTDNGEHTIIRSFRSSM